MLAQLLVRRIGSQQATVTANAFSRFTSSPTWSSVALVKDLPSQAGRMSQGAHKRIYQTEAAMGFLIRSESAPLLRRLTSHSAGNGLSQCKLSAFTTTRSLWGQGQPRKELIKQGMWRSDGTAWKQLPKQDTVRGFGTFSHFGQASLLLMLLGLSQLPAWGLIFANCAVYAMWEMEERHFMIRNFMVSVDSVLSGRLHTLLTYSISNNRLDNLIEAMLGLYFFGAEIAHIYGGSYMFNIYLVGALAGSIGHIAYCALLVPWLVGNRYDDFNYRQTPYALGANGATNALVVLHVLLFPGHLILANYLFPVPAIIFGAYLILADVWQVYEDGTRTTHAGHVVAGLMGVVAWMRITRGSRKPLR